MLLLVTVGALRAQASGGGPVDGGLGDGEAGGGDLGDLTGRVFVELRAEPAAAVPGQVVRLAVRFGVEREFLANGVLPLMRRELDLPVQVLEPWGEPLDGLVFLESVPVEGGARSLALRDGVGHARALGEESRDGQVFDVHELAARVRVASAGPVQVPPARLRVAYATELRRDLFGNAVAVDRRERVVPSEPLSLGVAEVPRAGRPDGFTGAVGRFDLTLGLSTRDLVVGEPFSVSLQLQGEGDLRGFAPPDLTALGPFHELGLRDRVEDGVRRLDYELAPTSADLEAFPAVPFSSYDPGPPAHWRTVVSEPLPVSVTGGEGLDPDTAPDAAEAPGGSDPAAEAATDSGAAEPTDGAAGPWVSALVALVVGLLAFGWGRASAQRGGAGPSSLAPAGPPEPSTGPDLAPSLRARIERLARDGQASAGPETLLLQALALRLGLPEAAVVDPRLGRRLRAAGVEAALADELEQALSDLMAQRYGGGDVAASEPGRWADLVERLARSA